MAKRQFFIKKKAKEVARKLHLRTAKKALARVPFSSRSLWSVVILIVALAAGAWYAISADSRVTIEGAPQEHEISVAYPAHPLTGTRCERYEARPIAVMLSGDSVTRPLSGVAQADMVIEMQVLQNGITRLMGIFACNTPEEIGSIRSSRDDFIPLAAAFDTIYAHWGGSVFALEQLRAGVINNIDALTNPANAFYRKSGVPGPHDGFTTVERLTKAAERLGYRTTTNQDMPEWAEEAPQEGGALTLAIGYPAPSGVQYVYSKENNRYLRWRNGSPEKDATTGDQAKAAVVVVMRSTQRAVEHGYNDVRVVGEGEAFVFQNGTLKRGIWKKSETPLSAPLLFFDQEGEKIAFIKGPVWISIVSTDTPVRWGEEVL